MKGKDNVYNLTRSYVTLKIKMLGGMPPVWAGDWVDLMAREIAKYDAGDTVLIRLGIAVELPKGYEAHILPRSSTFKNYGFLHAASGLIDEGYCGDNDEWIFLAYATRKGQVMPGERVCQFRIVKKQAQLSFQFVESLGNKNRGGFGSSGR